MSSLDFTNAEPSDPSNNAPELEDGGDLLAFAKMEMAGKDFGYDGMIADAVLDLIRTFAAQGHSGGSAPTTIGLFSKLASYEPLGPLTGEDNEWNEVGEEDGNKVYQNRRCSHVFKQANRFNGQAYDLQGRVFREPDGSKFTRPWDSWTPITFPYTPKVEFVDVPQQIDSPEEPQPKQD